MATISKRGTSYVLTWQQGGRQHRKSLGDVSAREAKIALNAKELELATGMKVMPSSTVFSAFILDYLDWHANEYPNSHFRIAQIINQHLFPHFEFNALDQIKIRDAEVYKTKRLKTGIKIATVNKELRTLKALLNKATEWEVISRNPLTHLKYGRTLDSKPHRFYSMDELETIYCSAPYNWHWWKFLSNTGLRRGEAAQLKWGHIADDKLVVVSSEDERTKSGKWREVPLNKNAKLALSRFRKENNGVYVFPRVTKESMTRAFERVLQRADIAAPKGSFHCLRHTFCSHLVMAGVPLRTVQKLAGHASFSTTEKYAHLSPDHLKNAMQKIEL